MSINDTRGLWRGKCVDNNNEWVEGDLSRINSADSYFIEDIRSKWLWRVDLSTLGECTGLRDKNGMLIFEGDIVEHKGERFVIKYIEKYMRFSPVKPGTVFAIFDYTQSEIIGNIHDNPELLKGADDK